MWGLELNTAGWVGFWIGAVLLAIAVTCVVTAIVLVSRRKATRRMKEAAGWLVLATLVTTIFGLLAFLTNLFTGLEKRDMLHDLANAGWAVISVDTGTDAGVIALGDTQVQVGLRQVGITDTWTPYLECGVQTSETGPQVDIQNCSRKIGH